MLMPLTIVPTIPTSPWSVPQMKRFFRWEVPSGRFRAEP